MKNHYEILGLESSATQEEIKKAYRKLSLKFHPDKNEGDAYFSSLFRQINDAYSVLSDTEKRRSYDEVRLRTEDASKLAESLKKRERDLSYREQQLRYQNSERPVYQAPKPDTSDGIKSNDGSGFTIVYLKYSLYVVIAMMVILIGSKQERVAEVQHEEQYSEATSAPKVKKKKRKSKQKSEVSEATIVEIPQVDSGEVQESTDNEADIAATSEPITEPETTEASVDSSQ